MVGFQFVSRKNPPKGIFQSIFFKLSSFLDAHARWFDFRLDALGANLDALAVHFLGLHVNAEFSFSGNVGMTAGISGFRSATTN